jgi:hypothetical protein
LCAASDSFEARFSGTTLISDYALSGSSALSFGTFSNGVLVHVVSTWNLGTAAGQAFRDGVLVGSSSDRNTAAAGLFTLSGRNGAGNYFAGELYDIRIYNRVISPAEVVTIFNSEGNDSIVDGLLNRWRMDESTAGIVFSGAAVGKDIGQNRQDLTSFTGAPTYVYNAPFGGRRRLT